MSVRWEQVVTRLEALIAGPSSEQQQLAAALGVELEDGTPARVAAAILGEHLSSALMRPPIPGEGNFDALQRVEEEIGVDAAPVDETTSVDVVSAWIATRYMDKTARGLRALQPVPGDVVEGQDQIIGQRVVSSISDSGRVYLKGRPTRSAWPNYLRMVSRPGEVEHDANVLAIDAALRNSRPWFASLPALSRFDQLEAYRLQSNFPSDEAIRELEDLLESGETDERPFQALIESSPQLLAPLVFGNWAAYVIPQQRLGAEYVTDFLVLGINSLGPQWLAVELEAPRHRLLNNDGTLTTAVRHGVQQIQDWREWLTTNVAYAQTELGLHSITNQVPGLVVIGRADPSTGRQPSRTQVQEQQDVLVHSWDWLLRQYQQTRAEPRVRPRIGKFPEPNPSLRPRCEQEDEAGEL